MAGARDLALSFEAGRQRLQESHDFAMIGPHSLLKDPQRPLEQQLCLWIAPLVQRRETKRVVRARDIWVVRPEDTLPDGDSPVELATRLNVIA